MFHSLPLQPTGRFFSMVSRTAMEVLEEAVLVEVHLAEGHVDDPLLVAAELELPRLELLHRRAGVGAHRPRLRRRHQPLRAEHLAELRELRHRRRRREQDVCGGGRKGRWVRGCRRGEGGGGGRAGGRRGGRARTEVELAARDGLDEVVHADEVGARLLRRVGRRAVGEHRDAHVLAVPAGSETVVGDLLVIVLRVEVEVAVELGGLDEFGARRLLEQRDRLVRRVQLLRVHQLVQASPSSARPSSPPSAARRRARRAAAASAAAAARTRTPRGRAASRGRCAWREATES